MIVAISSFELHIPQSRSLKEKRRVVKSLIERMHQRYRVSVAETDHHDLHQRAEIGLAAVFAEPHAAERALESIRDLLDSNPDAYLTRWDPQLIDEEFCR